MACRRIGTLRDRVHRKFAKTAGVNEANHRQAHLEPERRRDLREVHRADVTRRERQERPGSEIRRQEGGPLRFCTFPLRLQRAGHVSAQAWSNGWKETETCTVPISISTTRGDRDMVTYKRVIHKGYMAPFSYITPTNGANMASRPRSRGGPSMKLDEGFHTAVLPRGLQESAGGTRGREELLPRHHGFDHDGSKNQEQAGSGSSTSALPRRRRKSANSASYSPPRSPA